MMLLRRKAAIAKNQDLIMGQISNLESQACHAAVVDTNHRHSHTTQKDALESLSINTEVISAMSSANQAFKSAVDIEQQQEVMDELQEKVCMVYEVGAALLL